MLPLEHQKHRDSANKKYKYCSPYRLGIAVGESGEFLPPPQTYTERNQALYLQGVEEGRRRRVSTEAAGFVMTDTSQST